MDYVLVAFLVLLSGCFSGLTLGFFSLNLTSLQRKVNLRDKRAIAVYPIRKKGNLLLSTLLLGNVAVNAAISIILGDSTSGLVAGSIATGLIVVFGEILPQAVFSRYALSLAANSVWLVRTFIFLMFPLAYPISWLLDKMLGEEMQTIWSKKEIKEIIKHHEEEESSDIDEDEERIMIGALSFSEVNVTKIMTPKSVVFSLINSAVITSDMLKEIRVKGFTRIPVYSGDTDNITGVVFAKDLIGLDLDEKKTVEDLQRDKDPLSIKESMMLDTLMNHFIRQKRHIAIVYDSFGLYVGIVTLEDIMEEIMRVEIVDEVDVSVNMQELAQKKARKNILGD
ncbi:MAG: DUF21 domain-containing protein [Bacteroidia bacterium]|nr:DUF21 domain-containing protein [Bacteroidia bacterium]